MSYIGEACNALNLSLTRFVTLNPHQLAGHVANLDFRLAEIEHGFALIDGYHQRFERLKAGQLKHAQQHKTVHFSVEVFDPIGESVHPPRPGVNDHELKNLRRELSENAYRFLVRCHNTDLLDRKCLNACLEQIGIDLAESDLKQ